MPGIIAFRPIYLSKNKGLGNALKEALDYCSYDLVARMDSDDISAPYRFQLQLNAFLNNPEIDIVGGSITEFLGVPENIIGERTVEQNDGAIKSDMKKRCAMNHVAVMYKKQAVQEAGGYQDWYYNEDYYLWIRMMESGCSFANIPYPLVNVRTGADMSARRGGWKYFKSEQKLQKYMHTHGLISLPRYLYNVAIRFGGEVLAPNSVRQVLYKVIRKRFDVEKYSIRPNQLQKKEDGKYPSFSVATSVYKNDNPEWFDMALKSIIVDQTVKPSEVVLIVDGPVPDEINRVIEKYHGICFRY